MNSEMYLAKLKADFMAMDTDGNGVVTKEDLRSKATEIDYYVTEDELESIIQSMDLNDDGKISLEEFVAGAVSSIVRTNMMSNANKFHGHSPWPHYFSNQL